MRTIWDTWRGEKLGKEQKEERTRIHMESCRRMAQIDKSLEEGRKEWKKLKEEDEKARYEEEAEEIKRAKAELEGHQRAWDFVAKQRKFKGMKGAKGGAIRRELNDVMEKQPAGKARALQEHFVKRSSETEEEKKDLH